TALAITFMGLNIFQVVEYQPNTSPEGVRLRLDHYIRAADRLFLDYAVALDHDMGGMTYWGPELGEVIDTAGLVDIRFALHKRARYRRAFVEEDVFGERPFDFAHHHKNTNTASALRGVGLFQKEYVDIGGYPPRTIHHKGNWVRRSLFMVPSFTGRGEARFANEVELTGFRVPAPDVAARSELFVEVGLKNPTKEPFRLILFLVGDEGPIVSWEIPPGYDWCPAESWHDNEVFHGKFAVPIPAEYPTGAYDVGFVLLGADGSVIPALEPAEEPRFAHGEVRFPKVVRVVPFSRMKALSDGDKSKAIELAEADNCEGGERTWIRAKRRQTSALKWLE
ncbi:MAG: hypothetical protein HN348_36715, partial [Proteobacteria bacterium]|nr:hypothetical protein [Pseudomonadota bacterium]